MVKPEWGVKRTCNSCSAKFYDMRREPVKCPKCGAVLDLEALAKPRRSRAAPVSAEPKPAKPAPKRPAPEVELVEAAEGLEVEVEKTDDEEEEEVLEDTSELGEDEDDVAEVIEGVNEEEDR